MQLPDDERGFRNPFMREAKFIGALILILGVILLVIYVFGPFVDQP